MPRPPLLSSSSLHFLKSFCLLVPWAVRLSHSRHTLPIKFKTEASGERVWHFPPYLPLAVPHPHLPGPQISLAVRKGACWCLLHICPRVPTSHPTLDTPPGLLPLWIRPGAVEPCISQCSEAIGNVLRTPPSRPEMGNQSWLSAPIGSSCNKAERITQRTQNVKKEEAGEECPACSHYWTGACQPNQFISCLLLKKSVLYTFAFVANSVI
ncbi:uncharacterized protein LOC125936282 [Panthera uncia]|uniref:uncharacterized protein LOC125936282 n=1 Tax=Panthera uncia TaxID=29064 RepID=UPI0020FFAD3D|nr:uncharacterized protein LOC125936282 [Panthera uncia]